jgi:chromosome segregation ATPase
MKKPVLSSKQLRQINKEQEKEITALKSEVSRLEFEFRHLKSVHTKQSIQLEEALAMHTVAGDRFKMLKEQVVELRQQCTAHILQKNHLRETITSLTAAIKLETMK